MTEKIKAKNADVICALVNGETVEGRCLTDHMAGVMPNNVWMNLKLNFRSGFIDGDIVTNLLSINTLLTEEIYEFRLKHPHQDLIDQIESDSSLEQYLEMRYTDQNIQLHGEWVSYGQNGLNGLRADTIGRYQWRINKPAHPHQKLIDLIESCNFMLPCYMAVTGGWPPVRDISRQDMIKVLIDNPKDSFQIFTIAGESKGVKDE